MIELFPNVSEQVRADAEKAWRLAQTFHNPMNTVQFLSNYTKYAPTEEQQDFLRFYFNLQMELQDNEESNYFIG